MSHLPHSKAQFTGHPGSMELMYTIFYIVLIVGPLVIATICLLLMPVWYLVQASALVRRYGSFGWKAVGWSSAAIVLGYVVKPPVIYSKPLSDLDWVVRANRALLEGGERPPLPPAEFDLMRTMFGLVLQPPVFLFAAVLASFFGFRWLLRWQPQDGAN